MNLTTPEKTLCSTALRLSAIDLRISQPETAAAMEELAEKLSPLNHDENILLKHGYHCTKALAEASGRPLAECDAAVEGMSPIDCARVYNALYRGDFDEAKRIAFAG